MWPGSVDPFGEIGQDRSGAALFTRHGRFSHVPQTRPQEGAHQPYLSLLELFQFRPSNPPPSGLDCLDFPVLNFPHQPRSR